jgi:hypothetical protein
MKRILTWALFTALLCTSCRKRDSRSEIIARLEASGAGDVSFASRESLEAWFKQHSELAQETRKTCEKVKRAADVNWQVSAEGRVCSAAASAMFFHREPVVPDKRTFQ